MIVGGLEGGAVLGGIEAIFAGLLHLGLSKDSLAIYESELKKGRCLVILHGTADEVVQGSEVAKGLGIETVDVHAA
jgi:hypothetical protein